MEGFTKLLKIVTTFDGYAGELIDLFKDVYTVGDVRKDLTSVIACARHTRFIYNPGKLAQTIAALFTA